MALLAALALQACAKKPDESLRGTVGFNPGFLGGVVADEPRAALAGREILSSGGSAADAAVATYFALSVTLPTAATLGGGGVCLVHDRANDKNQMLDFTAPGPRPAFNPGAGQPAATPMNARGFFVLHSRHGRLRWAQLLAPAAHMARLGVPVSRALARDLAQAGSMIGADAEARRIFGRPDGSGPLKEGERLVQVDLAAWLDRIRTRGPGDLHVGDGARQLVQAYRTAGLALDPDGLRETVPGWRNPISIAIDAKGRLAVAHFAAPPAANGAVAGRIIAELADKDRYARAGAPERAALFVEAARRALAEHAPQLSLADGGAASAFVTADSEGMVVACAVTPHQPFGAGRVAPGTGVLAAALPSPGARGAGALAAMIVDDRRRDGAVFAAAASGGAAAGAAMAWVAARTLFEGMPLEDAIASARLQPAGPAGFAYQESHLDETAKRELAGRGVRLGAAPALGIVNALACPGGLLEKPLTCSLRTDPRGLGLAAGAD